MHILGPVASMGQRVLQPIVNQQVSHVLSALDKQVQETKAGGEVEYDGGQPAEGPADPVGSSGAEEGLNPLAPESYDPQPEGPTTSTEDA
ncbi:MAG: hypothetical protein E6G36_07905 [Actinobacteria bacterium]|nr:MAG: hypothetical protein E6G36_07905 [Actinomycetota bacterium]